MPRRDPRRDWTESLLPLFAVLLLTLLVAPLLRRAASSAHAEPPTVLLAP